MNALEFINSTALRDHLEKIGYKFSGLEAAYLVWNCRSATLDEKIAAWEEIIETYPDQPFRTWFGTKRLKLANEASGMKDFLTSYIELKRLESDFVKGADPFVGDDGREVPAVYYWSIREGGSSHCHESYETGEIYSDYASALDGAYDFLVDFEEDYLLTVYKTAVGAKMRADILLDGKGRIIDAHSVGVFREPRFEKINDRDESFESLWFGFPVPFRKGDILYDPERPQSGPLWSGPFVYTECATNIAKEKGRPLHDSSDMTAYGYFQNEDGSVYGDCMHDYTSLEYYPADMLTGVKRALIAYSNFVKGELEDELFTKAYAYILADEHAKELRPRYYTKEGMRLAGLEDKTDSTEGI